MNSLLELPSSCSTPGGNAAALGHKPHDKKNSLRSLNVALSIVVISLKSSLCQRCNTNGSLSFFGSFTITNTVSNFAIPIQVLMPALLSSDTLPPTGLAMISTSRCRLNECDQA